MVHLVQFNLAQASFKSCWAAGYKTLFLKKALEKEPILFVSMAFSPR